MRKVAIIGIGTTPFKTRYLDKTYFELAYDATKLALAPKLAGKGVAGLFFQWHKDRRPVSCSRAERPGQPRASGRKEHRGHRRQLPAGRRGGIGGQNDISPATTGT